MFFHFLLYMGLLLVEIKYAYNTLPNKAVSNKWQILKFIKYLEFDLEGSNMWKKDKVCQVESIINNGLEAEYIPFAGSGTLVGMLWFLFQVCNINYSGNVIVQVDLEIACITGHQIGFRKIPSLGIFVTQEKYLLALISVYFEKLKKTK